jgi:cytochrome c oxidase assembly protein subunit 15
MPSEFWGSPSIWDVLNRLAGFRVSPRVFRRAALVSVVALALVIVTGAAVRLTGSGLGCPDWPSCFQRRLTATWSFHPLVEFGNRLVVILVTVMVIGVALGSVLRKPFRSDLCWLAFGLVAGVVAQAVLGGLVVLFKLAPGLVMAHFALSIVVLADAVVLHRRAGEQRVPARAMVGRPLLVATRLMLALLGLVILAGTATTGSGPHAGNVGAKRLPIAFHSMTELHATLAVGLIGFTVGIVIAAHQVGIPVAVQRRARALVAVMAAQGVIGYTQYFLRVPAGVVELHIVGVTLLWMVAQRFYLGLFFRPALADVESAPVVPHRIDVPGYAGTPS